MERWRSPNIWLQQDHMIQAKNLAMRSASSSLSKSLSDTIGQIAGNAVLQVTAVASGGAKRIASRSIPMPPHELQKPVRQSISGAEQWIKEGKQARQDDPLVLPPVSVQ